MNSILLSAHPEGKEVRNVHTLPSEMLQLITLNATFAVTLFEVF